MDAHEITSRLPPLREDEPASLRQDIVDEILDHLQCGLRRELLVQGGDEASAKERVLSRFGDPREIARKLWFQAMWSQIMSQRIVVGGALFSMAVCAALVGMMVWVIQQQQANAAMQQQANAAMLEQIVKLIPQSSSAAEPQPSRVPHKIHLQVKATLDTRDGLPATGSLITVTKQMELGKQLISGALGTGSLTLPVDQTGLADCGLTEPGRFEISVRSASNETARVNFTVISEEDHIEHIVIPSHLPTMTKVVFRVGELPDELNSKGVGLVMRVRPRSSRTFEGRSWAPQGRWPNVSMPLVLLTKPQGLKICVEPEGSSQFYTSADHWIVAIDHVIKNGKWDMPHEWSLPAGEYTAQFGICDLGDPNTNDERWVTPGMGTMHSNVWLRATNKFVAAPGIFNEWTIELPDYVSMCISDPSKIPQTMDPASNVTQGQGGMGGGMGGMGGGGMGGGGMGGGGFF